MSEQAIETEEELETTEDIENEDIEALETEETPETEQESEDEGEVEIVLRGEDEPTSTPAPRGVRRLINRLETAKAETSEVERKLQATEAENELLRAKMQQEIEDKEPNADDFETDAEYLTAAREYDKRQLSKQSAEELKRLMAENQQQNTQVQNSQARNSELDEHYQRADKSGIKNYDELEGAAIEVMGQSFVEEIAANNEKAHIVLAHLGTNLGKAEKFAQLSKANPVKALLDIGALANELEVKRKHSRAADPEVTIDKGIATKDGYLKGARFE